MDITPTTRDYAKLARWVAMGSSLDEDRKIAFAADLERSADEFDLHQKDIDIIAR